MNPPATINISQLRLILGNLTRATAFGATTLTDARALKTGNPFGTIRKLVKINGMLGTDHAAAVERQRAREGVADQETYESKGRTWGERIGPALVQKGSEYYLSTQLNPTHHPKPLYLIEKQVGTKPRLSVVSKDLVAPWLPPDRTAREAAAQGVERPVIHRDYRLDSLVTLSLNGRRYRIRQPA
jgi:hypothetical protein